jgi:hypothetical protein
MTRFVFLTENSGKREARAWRLRPTRARGAARRAGSTHNTRNTPPVLGAGKPLR